MQPVPEQDTVRPVSTSSQPRSRLSAFWLAEADMVELLAVTEIWPLPLTIILSASMLVGPVHAVCDPSTSTSSPVSVSVLALIWPSKRTLEPFLLPSATSTSQLAHETSPPVSTRMLAPAAPIDITRKSSVHDTVPATVMLPVL